MKQQQVTLLNIEEALDHGIPFGRRKELYRTEQGRDYLRSLNITIPHKMGNRSPKEKPFIAWDGEGITFGKDVAQSYVLFANSVGQYITDRELGTRQCLELLIQCERANPDAIHVGFGLKYDVNMILRDLSRNQLEYLYRKNHVWWENFRLEYRPGKWLTVKHRNTTVRLFDVFGFFQQSFVSAIAEYLGPDDPELVRVRKGKAARQQFKWRELEGKIIPYCQAELRLLVRLMDSLRNDLINADLHITSWHGPGAVASVTLRKRGVADLMNHDITGKITEAAQYAYAGGRFEQYKVGHYSGTVYEYDINSAYPSAIADLPNLRDAKWEWSNDFIPNSFGVWECEYRDLPYPDSDFRAQPFFYRNSSFNIYYPSFVVGWYWTPEIVGGFTFGARGKLNIKGGYILRHDGSKPFSFIREMYATRKQWKAEGNSAQRAYKLALNSIYGKFAQRAGWTEENDSIPRWHQLEWAGYITATTRAKIWEAISLAPGNIVAVETDAVFSTVPLPLDCGTNLGQWEVSEFDWITYLQSGVYFAGANGGIIEKYRGFDPGTITHKETLRFLSGKRRTLSGKSTRFVGMGSALRGEDSYNDWRKWITADRELTLATGKRIHYQSRCVQCRDGIGLHEGVHTLMIGNGGDGMSVPHPLPWTLPTDTAPSPLRLEAW